MCMDTLASSLSGQQRSPRTCDMRCQKGRDTWSETFVVEGGRTELVLLDFTATAADCWSKVKVPQELGTLNFIFVVSTL